MASGYGVGVEWTELILNFLGQIAWPLVVLVLGLRFRKPLVKLLTVNGPLKSLSAGSVSAEWEVEARVDRAKDKTAPEAEDESDSTDDEEPEAPSHSEDSNGHEPLPPKPPTETHRHAGTPVEFLRLAREDPTRAILQSAEELRRGLSTAVWTWMRTSSGRGGGSRSMPLYLAIRRAYSADLLTSEELEAAEELAVVRNRLTHAEGDVYVDVDTAFDYGQASRRLVRSALRRAQQPRLF